MIGRVVIVHERLTELGGSERVVEHLAALFPNRRVFVPVADPDLSLDGLAGVPLSTSPLQRLYRGGGRYAYLLPLLPAAMAGADLSDASLVVVSHHAFANRVRVPPGVPVISYTHTPARWIWDPSTRSGEAGGPVGRHGLGLFAASQRRADRRAAGRLSALVVNSRAVAARARRWWGQEALVVPPPVDTDFYTPDRSTEREDFFLLAGRLVPYKRPEVAVAAATAAGVRLVVAGEGRARAAAEAVAGPTVSFMGRVGDDELRDLYRRCRALLFPGEEDFGIVPVEAQACGAPVIALDAGGARDSVVPGVTGVLVPAAGGGRSAVADFARVLRRFGASEFDSAAIRQHAEGFSGEQFRRRMTDVTATVLTGGPLSTTRVAAPAGVLGEDPGAAALAAG